MTSVHDDHDQAVFTAPLDSFTTHLEHYDHHEHHDNYALNTQPLLQDELLLRGGHNLGHHDFLYEHHSEFEWLAHMDLSQHDMTQDLSSSMNVVEDESYFDEEHKKSGIFIPRGTLLFVILC
jgi:hypothetical protein